MDDRNSSKNMMLAIALSVMVVVGWQYFFVNPKIEEEKLRMQQQKAAVEAMQPQANRQPFTVPGEVKPQQSVFQPRDKALGASDRVMIDTSSLKGSLSLKGGRIDDLILKNYHQTSDKRSDSVVLLSPSGYKKAYFAEFGYTTQGTAGAASIIPQDAIWEADKNQVLTANQPITLTWKNDQGLKIDRRISIDDKFMFQIEDVLSNTGTQDIAINSFALVKRNYELDPNEYHGGVVHEGHLGWLDNALQEYNYTAMQDEPIKDFTLNQGGWLGITDKYWMVAIAPEQNVNAKGRFLFSRQNGVDGHQSDYIGEAQTIAAGQSVTIKNYLFAGAKVVSTIESYQKNLGIKEFDYAIDWGWFWFFTQPIFKVLSFLNQIVGNFGIAILILTLMMKILFFPLSYKSYKAMSKMKKAQPELQRIREDYKDDPMKQQQLLIELYKKERINPVSGCLPILLQIPVFFALYKVLSVAIEMRHAPFYGWITDLSAKDPTNIFTLFGLIPVDMPGFLHLGVLPVLMGITMWVQQKLNPSVPDPIQARMLSFMPIIFTFILAPFAAGLVLYWTWNNILSIIQQWFIMRRVENGEKK